MNTILCNTPNYITKQISDRISNDKEIVNLSFGEPYFKPPTVFGEELFRTISQGYVNNGLCNKYSDSRGNIKLRQEIAHRYKRLYSANIDYNHEVLITHGAIEAIWISIIALTSIGDEIIIPDPSYALYETAVKLLGRVPKRVPSLANKGFCIEVEGLERFLSDRTKLLIINSPENPTGAVYNSEKLNQILELALKRNFFVLHDEVYDSYVYIDKHVNYFSNSAKTCRNWLTINSFSKKYSLMGWRLGWILGEKKIVENLIKVHTNLTLNLNSFHQDAASELLNNVNVEREVKGYMNSIRSNMIQIMQIFQKIEGVNFMNDLPKGGFFLFPDVSRFYDKIPEKFKKFETIGECVMEYMLFKYKIAVVPGYIFGPSGENFIRIMCAISPSEISKLTYRFKKRDNLKYPT